MGWWLRKCVLLGIALSILQAAVPAQAQQIEQCAKFADRLDERDVDWIRFRLRESFPAEHFGTLDSIAIAEVEDDDLLGPRYFPGENPRIELPRHFYRRLCTQIVFQTLYAARPDADYSSVETRIEDCLASGGARASCLEQAFRAYLTEPTAGRNARGNRAYRQDIARRTFGAASFLIAHEAAHAILRATLTPDELMETDEEMEADVYAILPFLDSLAVPEGPQMALAAISLAEPDDPIFAVTHEPAACRYERVRTVVAAVAPAMLRAIAFGEVQSPYSRKEMREAMAALERPLMLEAAADGSCLEADHSLLGTVTAEMDEAIAVVGNVKSGWIEDKKANAMLARLQALSPTTRVGEMVKTTVALDTLSRSRSFAHLRALQQDSAVTREQIALTGKTLNRIGSLAASVDAGKASPSTQAELLYFNALQHFHAQPRGTGIRAVARRVMDRLEGVFALNDPAAAVRRSFYVKERSEGRVTIDNRIAFAGVELYTVMQILTGDCSDPGLSSRLRYPAFLSAIGQQPKPMSPEQCTAFKRGEIAKLEGRHGWRWDGPPL